MKVLMRARRFAAALAAIGTLLALPMAASADSNKFIEGNGPISKTDPLAVAERFTYVHFKTDPQAATKTSAGVVHTVTINTKGSANSHVALWDAAAWATSDKLNVTGGTLVADIDTTVTVGTILLDADFTNGVVISCLTGQTATSCSGTNTAAGEPDVTLSYR